MKNKKDLSKIIERDKKNVLKDIKLITEWIKLNQESLDLTDRLNIQKQLYAASCAAMVTLKGWKK